MTSISLSVSFIVLCKMPIKLAVYKEQKENLHISSMVSNYLVAVMFAHHVYILDNSNEKTMNANQILQRYQLRENHKMLEYRFEFAWHPMLT